MLKMKHVYLPPPPSKEIVDDPEGKEIYDYPTQQKEESKRSILQTREEKISAAKLRREKKQSDALEKRRAQAKAKRSSKHKRLQNRRGRKKKGLMIVETEEQKLKRLAEEKEAAARRVVEEAYLGSPQDLSETISRAVEPQYRDILSVFRKSAVLGGCQRFGRLRCASFMSMARDIMRIPPFANIRSGGKANTIFHSQERLKVTAHWQCKQQGCWSSNEPHTQKCLQCGSPRPPPDPQLEETLRNAIWSKPKGSRVCRQRGKKIDGDDSLPPAAVEERKAEAKFRECKAALEDEKAKVNEAFKAHADALSSGIPVVIDTATRTLRKARESELVAKQDVTRSLNALRRCKTAAQEEQARMQSEADDRAADLHVKAVEDMVEMILNQKCNKKYSTSSNTKERNISGDGILDTDDNTLSRHEFVLALLWIGKVLYKDMLGASLVEGIKRFFSMHFSLVVAHERRRTEVLEPLCYSCQFTADGWRSDNLYTPSMNWFLSTHIRQFESLFMILATRESGRGGVTGSGKNRKCTRLPLHAWQRFVKDDAKMISVIESYYSNRDSHDDETLRRRKNCTSVGARGETELRMLFVRFLFQESQMVLHRSAESDRKDSLSFHDFLEATVRAAAAESVLRVGAKHYRRREEAKRPLLLRFHEIWTTSLLPAYTALRKAFPYA
jgi:hypothetical protein